MSSFQIVEWRETQSNRGSGSTNRITDHPVTLIFGVIHQESSRRRRGRRVSSME